MLFDKEQKYFIWSISLVHHKIKQESYIYT